MSVSCVLRRDIPVTSAHQKVLQEVLELKARHPGWVHNLMWNDLDLGISRAATWTEYAEPLPSILSDEFHNIEALSTISNFPHLFKIVTPINACRLKLLLAHHPNWPFVNSVIQGFLVGFWLYAHTYYGTYPTTVDDSGDPPKTLEQVEFLHKQILTEINADHYSSPFGPELLPSMYSTPILEVLRKSKLRLCNH